MTKQEVVEYVRNSYLKFCKDNECKTCPYDKYFLNCELYFIIDYLNKRHLLKAIEKESTNNEE